MENHQQKWISVSFAATAALLAFVAFQLGSKVVGAYDLEAQIRNVDLILRVGSIALGAVAFAVLYSNDRVNEFMAQVVVEVGRVTWPTEKETAYGTLMVIVMVLISGFFLGFLDWVWAQLLKLVL